MTQQTMMEATVLDAVVLVQLDIRASDLSVKVDPKKDLQGVALPPSVLMSTGVKHYVDPALKAPFAKLKKRAERLCGEVGFPLLKGWALPKDKAPEVLKELKAMASEYVNEANDLKAKLPAEFVKWEAAHPGWEHLFHDRPTPDAIHARYRFRHPMYRMRPAGEDGDDVLNDALGVTGGSLLEAILEDVAASANEILAKTFEGRSEVTGRCLSAIAALGKKLTGFAFIDPLVLPVATMIGEVIGNIGNMGNSRLDVTHTSALRGLLQMLAEPEKLRKHGAMQQLAPQSDADVIVVVEAEASAEATQETNPHAEVIIPPPAAQGVTHQSALML